MHTSRNILLSIVIIIAGAAISVVLASSRKTPPRQERSYPGPLVEAVSVELADHPVTVRGHGTVQARLAVQLIPQVGGQVIATHPQLIAGGYFAAGEQLLRIDPADYELAVQRADAAVARAEVNLQMQEAEAEVARREWQRLHPGEQPPSPLVVRQPQVEQARAELASARADLATARLNLQRTSISLPFAGRVLSESVGISQMVVAGQPVASVYGTEVMEIPVPLEDGELAWFDVPDGTGQRHRAEAAVHADFAGARHTWQGRVVRTEGQVDPATRMVQVVVAVSEPMSQHPRPQPLVPGMFVEVEIAGHTLPAVAAIPRHAVHDGDQVWVADDGQLHFRSVEVVRLESDLALISEGLEPGNLVVTSQLDVVTDGMKVRTSPADDAAAGGEEQS